MAALQMDEAELTKLSEAQTPVLCPPLPPSHSPSHTHSKIGVLRETFLPFGFYLLRSNKSKPSNSQLGPLVHNRKLN